MVGIVACGEGRVVVLVWWEVIASLLLPPTEVDASARKP
jgi:hypothetical protein